jgi:hypothetical protein
MKEDIIDLFEEIIEDLRNSDFVSIGECATSRKEVEAMERAAEKRHSDYRDRLVEILTRK